MKKPTMIRAPKTPPPPALDQEQIVQAALGLLDEVGFEGLTMRALAHKLGIKAASLYWHVRDKQELLSLLAEEICAGMREPDRTSGWRKQLEELGDEYRRVLLAHRDGARVLASSGGPSGANRLRLTEMVFSTLLKAGLSKKDAAYAGFLMNDFVTMFVLEEVQAMHSETDTAADDAFPSAQNWIQALSPEQYPSVIALADYLWEPDADKRFRFGVEVLGNGLEMRLAKQVAND